MLEKITTIAGDFAMIFVGLLVESMPFVVIGVTISCLIAKFVKVSDILKYKSKNPVLSHLQCLFIGTILPVCECGNIPLAKRLSLMGFRPSEIITFILASPIFNPLVLATTLIAFSFDPRIGFARVLIGGFIALFTGLLFSFAKNPNELMATIVTPKPKFSFSSPTTTPELIKPSLVDTFRHEFFESFKMLSVGCFLAAGFQSIIPRSFFATFAQSPTLSVLALMGLAFLISICSSVDAFFALSFVGIFNFGAIISFLVFGPMIDIKTLSMLSGIFKIKTLILLTILVALCSLVAGLGINYFYLL